MCGRESEETSLQSFCPVIVSLLPGFISLPESISEILKLIIAANCSESVTGGAALQPSLVYVAARELQAESLGLICEAALHQRKTRDTRQDTNIMMGDGRVTHDFMYHKD